MSTSREIRLIEDEELGGWSAIDVETGVASQGETRQEALENLDEAVALHSGEAGEPIEDVDEYLREIGIDPDEIDEGQDVPEFLH